MTNYTKAKQAFYVIDHKLRGAMGPTLASFKERETAQGFVDKQGGKVILYKDISLDLLSGILFEHTH